jgi:hypothetical protein
MAKNNRSSTKNTSTATGGTTGAAASPNISRGASASGGIIASAAPTAPPRSAGVPASLIPSAPVKPSVTPRSDSPTHEQIAKRAYEIWVARGRPHGKDAENWRQAERELLGR